MTYYRPLASSARHGRFAQPRIRRVALTATVALGLVAGCGSDSTDESTATAPGTDTAAVSLPASSKPSLSPPSTGPHAADAFPVTVEHAYGSTEIPSEPTRVVSVGYNDQDPILAVGVVPVGVMPWYDDEPIGFFWSEERYGDELPETVGGGEFLEINFEKVAALDPDLIIGASGMREVDYTKASEIAPTIPQPPGEADYSSAPWQETQRLVGAALGRSAEAEAVIADVERGLDGVREAHPEFAGRTAVVAQVYEGQYAVRGSAEVWSEFLADLGFIIPEDIVGPDYTEISAERVEAFADLDVIVWLGTPDEVSSPLYDTLAVTQDGRDVYVESLGELSGAIGFNSAISLPIVIERLVPMLAAAIDGDPTTPVPE